MTSQMETTQNFDVVSLPILITVTFSSPVSQFDSSHCVTVNGQVKAVDSRSDREFQISLYPILPGFLSVTLSKSLTSTSGATLINPPILEFNYIGASIITSRIQTVSSTTASIVVTTSNPVYLSGLYSEAVTSIKPSSLLIFTQGQLQSSTLSTNHQFLLHDLSPKTRYIIYFAGKEESGVLMENEDASLTVTTRGEDAPEDYESRSDGTVCESGWGVSSSGELQLLPCSNRGYCRQRQCICSAPYSAGNCGQVIEDPLDRSNETHKLIHVHLDVTAVMRAQQQLIGYWQVSLRESGLSPRVRGSCGGASVGDSGSGSDSAVGNVRYDDAARGDASRATIIGIPRDKSAGDSDAFDGGGGKSDAGAGDEAAERNGGGE
ncbi:hypothetical protein WA588_002849 [Blastocystis sp. NMH]